MRDWLLDILGDPVDGSELTLVEGARTVPRSSTGTLRGSATTRSVTASPASSQPKTPGSHRRRKASASSGRTSTGFGSDGMQEKVSSWILERYGFGSGADMRAYFARSRKDPRRRLWRRARREHLARTGLATRWERVRRRRHLGSDRHRAAPARRDRRHVVRPGRHPRPTVPPSELRSRLLGGSAASHPVDRARVRRPGRAAATGRRDHDLRLPAQGPGAGVRGRPRSRADRRPFARAGLGRVASVDAARASARRAGGRGRRSRGCRPARHPQRHV